MVLAIDFLDRDYHYVIWTLVYAIVMNIFLALKVGKARKKHGVDYPAMYSEKDNIFNCIQRAHQNTLEQLPIFLALLIVVGMALPKYAAGCGCLFITSRFSYAYGYYTGNPKKRLNGEYGVIGYLGLLVGLAYVGFVQGNFIEPINFPKVF